ncbi:MAG TPA: hypothetical protein VFO89_00345 [Thermoanaerobaculia bacterium]|nr:hypothetical protein [Thermoanaerobaculia bacterium]
MDTRQFVHEIVDKLPESELMNAARILKALETPADRFLLLLAESPVDDEPFDASDLEEDDPNEPSIPHDEVIRRFS